MKTKKILNQISCKGKKIYKVHKYCIAIISILVLTFVATAFMYPGFLKTKGSAFTISQDDWSVAEPGSITTDLSGWNKYDSATNIVYDTADPDPANRGLKLDGGASSGSLISSIFDAESQKDWSSISFGWAANIPDDTASLSFETRTASVLNPSNLVPIAQNLVPVNTPTEASSSLTKGGKTYGPGYAVDHVYSPVSNGPPDSWINNFDLPGGDTNQWIAVDLGSAKTIGYTKITSALISQDPVNANPTPDDYQIEYSTYTGPIDADHTWETIGWSSIVGADENGNINKDDPTSIVLENNFGPIDNVKYVRLFLPTISAVPSIHDSKAVVVSEIEVYSSAPASISAAASSSQTDHGPELAFDGSNDTFWASSTDPGNDTNQWIAVDLNNPQTIGDVKITSTLIGQYNSNAAPDDYQIQYSTYTGPIDGSHTWENINWTDILGADEGSNLNREDPASVIVENSFTPIENIRYIRVFMPTISKVPGISNPGAGDPVVVIKEIGVYGGGWSNWERVTNGLVAPSNLVPIGTAVAASDWVDLSGTGGVDYSPSYAVDGVYDSGTPPSFMDSFSGRWH